MSSVDPDTQIIIKETLYQNLCVDPSYIHIREVISLLRDCLSSRQYKIVEPHLTSLLTRDLDKLKEPWTTEEFIELIYDKLNPTFDYHQSILCLHEGIVPIGEIAHLLRKREGVEPTAQAIDDYIQINDDTEFQTAISDVVSSYMEPLIYSYHESKASKFSPLHPRPTPSDKLGRHNSLVKLIGVIAHRASTNPEDHMQQFLSSIIELSGSIIPRLWTEEKLSQVDQIIKKPSLFNDFWTGSRVETFTNEDIKMWVSMGLIHHLAHICSQ